RSTRLWFISLRAVEQHVRVCEQHAAIVDGVRRRDPDAAEAAIREHIESFRDNLTRQICVVQAECRAERLLKSVYMWLNRFPVCPLNLKPIVGLEPDRA